MKVYFYTKILDEKPERNKAHEQIIDYFYKNGVMVLSNISERKYETAQLGFENMDGLVIEGPEVVSEVGYLIALALAQQKLILYLLPKGTPLPDQIRDLINDKNLKKLFLLKFYSDKILDSLLLDFIDIIETGELRREVPTIKFTLRFTPRVERYLRWKSMKTKLSKADFLRKLVDESIKNDETYQSHLRRQRKDEEKSDLTPQEEIVDKSQKRAKIK